ncbi:beta-galactosidase [Vagococcus silagei]|uniref:beta-galactosidase n=1 Tax=Vagococcus silagei TaxID=2508885 RepID=UPI0026CCDC6E
MLENGTISERALPTINCGSKIKEDFAPLKKNNGQKRPLMVMEFWIGWFDAWGDEGHHIVDEQVTANELAVILAEGSVNIYMFHGSTNFGFMNGSNYYGKLTPDVTSYDYEALLTEWGGKIPNYHAFQKAIAQYTKIPEVKLSTTIKKMD